MGCRSGVVLVGLVQCDGERWDEGCSKMGWLFLWLGSRCLVGWNIKIDGGRRWWRIPTGDVCGCVVNEIRLC